MASRFIPASSFLGAYGDGGVGASESGSTARPIGGDFGGPYICTVATA